MLPSWKVPNCSKSPIEKYLKMQILWKKPGRLSIVLPPHRPEIPKLEDANLAGTRHSEEMPVMPRDSPATLQGMRILVPNTPQTIILGAILRDVLFLCYQEAPQGFCFWHFWDLIMSLFQRSFLGGLRMIKVFLEHLELSQECTLILTEGDSAKA